MEESLSPAFGGFQMITETLTEPVAMDGVVLTLGRRGLTGPTPIHVAVKEPIFPIRDWLAGRRRVTPNGKGRQTFTIHLTGRPVISFPKDELKLPRNTHGQRPRPRVGRPGHCGASGGVGHGQRRVQAGRVPGRPGKGHTHCHGRPDRIRPRGVRGDNEGTSGTSSPSRDGAVCTTRSAGWCISHRRSAPDHATGPGGGLSGSSRCLSRSRRIPMAPEWAFWQRQAFNECKRILNWIIDNRGVETGEFGGVWGDDTDMTEYWTHDALAGEDDGEIADALRKFWSGLYKHGLKDGVSAGVRDNFIPTRKAWAASPTNCSSITAIPLPSSASCAPASHYEKWMAQNPDGTYRFLGNYLGWAACGRRAPLASIGAQLTDADPGVVPGLVQPPPRRANTSLDGHAAWALTRDRRRRYPATRATSSVSAEVERGAGRKTSHGSPLPLPTQLLPRRDRRYKEEWKPKLLADGRQLVRIPEGVRCPSTLATRPP